MSNFVLYMIIIIYILYLDNSCFSTVAYTSWSSLSIGPAIPDLICISNNFLLHIDILWYNLIKGLGLR